MRDCIYRDAAINACFDGWNMTVSDAEENIRNLPAADVRPVVRGKWKPSMCGTVNGPIQDRDEWYGPLFLCSECGADMIGASNYRPNCGADMRETNDGI